MPGKNQTETNFQLQFKTLFEKLPDLYLILSPDFEIMAVSDNYLAATNKKRAHVLGHNIFKIYPEIPGNNTMRELKASIDFICQNKVQHVMPIQQYDIKLPDSSVSERYWSCTNTPILDSENKLLYIINKIEDVTEFVKLQNKANKANKQQNNYVTLFKTQQTKENTNSPTAITSTKLLQNEWEDKFKKRTLELTKLLEKEQALNELKSKFVALASHEFRTPITTISSSLSLLESYNNGLQEEKRLRHIAKIKTAVNNLVEIMEDFLSIEKIENSQSEIKKDFFNLHEFTTSIIEQLNVILKNGQQIKLSYNGIKLIWQDKKILKNILINLISNAIKYSAESKEINIWISASEAKVAIKITDEGIGIPFEEQKNVFSKFFRASNVLAIQGTGLGLNIVKRYMELIDGKISFTSKPFSGSSFLIEFPNYLQKE
jgi:signal transduction histidine kinase